MILLLDNYDSFTFNLAQYINEIKAPEEELLILRNDEISIKEVAGLPLNHIVISPGPCTPKEAGISVPIVKQFSGTIPILGVCLGHQAIAEAFGAEVVRAQRIFHGKTSTVTHTNQSIFRDIPQDFQATRYHSLEVKRATLPDCLEVLASSSDCEAEIMALRHIEFTETIGVQFHPESILTDYGKPLLSTFLALSTACSKANESKATSQLPLEELAT
ncbi:UNVERIFIED_CONTAM: hypothetical protein GTU68_024065 [Idotea baltica]|nr:hypothetical protein [Idotea baltica]